MLASSLVLAGHSKFFADILSTLNFCDGCSEKRCIILADEDKDIVKQTLEYIHKNIDEASLDIQTQNRILEFGARFNFSNNILFELEKAPR